MGEGGEGGNGDEVGKRRKGKGTKRRLGDTLWFLLTPRDMKMLNKTLPLRHSPLATTTETLKNLLGLQLGSGVGCKWDFSCLCTRRRSKRPGTSGMSYTQDLGSVV